MLGGLTILYPLAEGLSETANLTTIALDGDLAEIAAGSITMGLGGFPVGRLENLL